MFSIMLCAAALGTLPAEPPASNVPKIRLERLAKGINLSHWFAQSGTYSDEHLTTYLGTTDAELIASARFRHVRLTFEPEILWKFPSGNPNQLDPHGLKMLDSAIRMFLDRKIAVIVDVHPSNEQFKLQLKDNRAHQTNFAAFWGTFASHLKKYDPDWVYLEILNEPMIDDPEGWWRTQGTVLAAIRKSAPDHTVIVSPDEWTSVPRLTRMKPYDDPNVVYNFHCYEPFIFTHQGATWGWELTRHMKNLPYPSSPDRVARMIDQVTHPEARAAVLRYGEDRWNAAKVEATIAEAAAWGRRHRVPLTCNEFGVYRAFSPAEDRLQCLADVRGACEKFGIGWSMWDYAGGFAVAVGDRGKRTLDPGTLRALGL